MMSRWVKVRGDSGLNPGEVTHWLDWGPHKNHLIKPPDKKRFSYESYRDRRDGVPGTVSRFACDHEFPDVRVGTVRDERCWPCFGCYADDPAIEHPSWQEVCKKGRYQGRLITRRLDYPWLLMNNKAEYGVRQGLPPCGYLLLFLGLCYHPKP